MDSGAIYPSLRDRVVLVTGGASGIGESIVEHFCRQRARVAFLDRDAEAGTALCERLAAAGLPVPAFRNCDLRDIAAMRAAIDGIGKALGPVTVLINHAANDERNATYDDQPEDLDDKSGEHK